MMIKGSIFNILCFVLVCPSPALPEQTGVNEGGAAEEGRLSVPGESPTAGSPTDTAAHCERPSAGTLLSWWEVPFV
ncbi:hypothetical protein AAFF_G00059800 [Aldrovandia affinis]|uniref:Uncharacterized protein n=1 Tax=Aldrovandia affinis TaxID=143900 RepID=A0AAD7WDZ2_9TELE|nr:hypothetical protein AAFF_G00059800 [Aldrovandia affinis]